ncbi:HEPN domain-containing protein [Bacillaceae bacterium S4-13-58]
MIFYSNVHAFYNGIAQENYNNFKILSKRFSELTNGGLAWDFGNHTQKENETYQNTHHEMQKQCIISIVFLVMAIESLINDYGFVHLGEKRFNELDRNSIKDKIKDFYFEVTGGNFPTDKVLFQQINDLVSIRNNLVHSKTLSIDLNLMMQDTKEADEAFFSYINSIFGNSKEKKSKQKHMYEVLDSAHGAYEDLMVFLID